MQDGYVLLHRKMLDNPALSSPLRFKLWVWMLMRANFKDRDKLKRGEFITTIAEMRKAMGYKVGFRFQYPTKAEIRYSYEALVNNNMISTTKTTVGMIITILNYDKYQSNQNCEQHNEQHTDHHMNNTVTTQDTEIKIINVIKENILSSEKPKNNFPVKEVIDNLNRVAGTNFNPTTKKTISLIKARFKEGFSLEDFFAVNELKAAQWSTDEKMSAYVRPQTLYSGNFEAYLQESKKTKPPEVVRRYVQLV